MILWVVRTATPFWRRIVVPLQSLLYMSNTLLYLTYLLCY